MNSVKNRNENKTKYKRRTNYNKQAKMEDCKQYKKSNSRNSYGFKKNKNESKKTNEIKKEFSKNYNYSKISTFKRVREKSCGCIIIKNGKVLLIQQKKGSWGFPKGHVEFNETEIQTAIREVKEETNLDVRIFNKRRYTEKYYTAKGRVKQVVYFVAKQTGGIGKIQESEINEMKWFDFNDAFKKITYPNTKFLFGKVLRDLK